MLTALSSMMVDALATPTSIAMLFASVVALVLLWVLFLPDQRHVQAFTFDSIKSFAESAPESVAEQLSKSKRWWDDLAPPFSMNSLEEIEHDEDLAVYNSLGAHVAHFCFLFHGYQGRSEDLSYLHTVMEVLVEKEKRKIIEKQQTNPSLPRQDLIVHSVVANERRTADGVINGGERALEEMLTRIRRYSSEKREICQITVSVVGNSLGGIYSRYAIARLAEICDSGKDEIMLMDSVHPIYFNVFCTTATPHLGISKHTYLPLPRLAEIGVAHSMGRTGKDLFRCNDLVKSMATSPKYLKPLGSFRKRIAYANAFGTDFPVPVGTAAFLSDQSTYPHYFVEANDNDDDCGVVMDDNGLVIATMHTPPNRLTPNGEGLLLDKKSEDDLVQMSNALDSLGWKKVFVDVRKEIPFGVSLPRNLSRNFLSQSDHGNSEVINKKLEELKAQKGVSVESRMLKEAISAPVPLSQSRLSLPLGHNMICAVSRSRMSTYMNKGGRPVVDSLAKELVEDIFLWTASCQRDE